MKELQNALQDKIDYALLTGVSDTVSEVMTDHIIRDVYDVYNPLLYLRRYNQGGLLDKNNINSSIEEDTLIVENNTKGNPYLLSASKGKEIVEIIETGNGYDFENWEYYGIPRPFIQNTRDDLKANKYHVKALKQGLKKQGLEVE